MKARIASVFVCVAGLVLLLVVAFGAKGSEVNAANPPSPNALPASNAGDLAHAVRNPATLGYTSILTFTPAFTTYLPLVDRNSGLYGFHPGQTLPDTEMDVSLACIDVIRMHSTLSETVLNSTLGGGTLQVTFDLRDVPPELTFNWEVGIDIDNDPQTGCPWYHATGAEYELMAFHAVYTPNSPVTIPIQDAVEVYVYKYNPDDNRMEVVQFADIEVDAESDTLTLTGYIPEITTQSRLFFVTYDRNPGGQPEWDESPGITGAGQGSQHWKFGIPQVSSDGTAWRWIPNLPQ